jgi:hypothetical protein
MVQMEPGLHHSRHTGIFLSIKSIPGVKVVTDMSVLSRETLDFYLLPSDQVIRRGRRRRRPG